MSFLSNISIQKYTEITKKSVLGSPLLTVNFKQSKEHEVQQLCIVNRPISLHKRFNNLLVKIFAL